VDLLFFKPQIQPRGIDLVDLLFFNPQIQPRCIGVIVIDGVFLIFKSTNQSVKIRNGVFKGLNSLSRSSDAIVTYDESAVSSYFP